MAGREGRLQLCSWTREEGAPVSKLLAELPSFPGKGFYVFIYLFNEEGSQILAFKFSL